MVKINIKHSFENVHTNFIMSTRYIAHIHNNIITIIIIILESTSLSDTYQTLDGGGRCKV